MNSVKAFRQSRLMPILLPPLLELLQRELGGVRGRRGVDRPQIFLQSVVVDAGDDRNVLRIK
jgi:hypothetical protein